MTRRLTLFLALFLLPALLAQDDRSGPGRLTLEVGPEPSAVVAGDLDGDFDLDLVVPGGDSVTVLIGNGKGDFQPLDRVAAGANAVNAALADFDEDGDLDLAVANHDTDYISLLLGDGTGRLQASETSLLRLGIDPHPHAVLAADLDHDGHIDLLVDERNREGIRVVHGRGDGSFDLPGATVAVGGDPYRGMALADVNGDGRLDLITPNPTAAAVLLAEVDGSFGEPRSVPATRPFVVRLADLNGDGALDLVSASESGHLEIFYGDGTGGFASAGEARRLPAGGKNAVPGDFNGDGIGDVAIANWTSREVVLLMGSPEGAAMTRVPAGRNPWGLAAADLNGDGCDDLAVTNQGDDELLIVLSVRAGELCEVR